MDGEGSGVSKDATVFRRVAEWGKHGVVVPRGPAACLMSAGSGGEGAAVPRDAKA